MTKEQYEKLFEQGHFEPLWIELLNASGFAGCTRTGQIVDRRWYPDAHPVQANKMFGIAPPKKLKNMDNGK